MRLHASRAGTWLAVAAGVAIASSAPPAEAGTKNLSPEMARLTNARYGHDCFWAPPKGMDYADLPGAMPIQKPNLFPDVASTYFVAQYLLPEGAHLTFHGRYPHERYMSWTIFKSLDGNQIGPGDHLRDSDILPDPGSANPFLPGHRRDGRRRRYTLRIRSGAVPAQRARNTVYTGYTDPKTRIGMSIRNYVPDIGRDGTGDAGLPTLTLTLANGTRLHGKAACDMLAPTKDAATGTFSKNQWKLLVATSSDPENAPATDPPQWARFWNAKYSVAGAFIPVAAAREAVFPPTDDGGFQSNPDTRYLIAPISLKFGPVVLVTGKLPVTPATLPAARAWPDTYQVRFWSMCTGSSPVSGFGYDCVFDQQVPLRGDRRYALVISRPADRPRNARPECGYRWMDFGDGESYPDPASRDYVDTLYMRFMAADPGFAQAPQKVQRPGTEQAVMGPYLPQSRYTTKAAFEATGCPNYRK